MTHAIEWMQLHPADAELFTSDPDMEANAGRVRFPAKDLSAEPRDGVIADTLIA